MFMLQTSIFGQRDNVLIDREFWKAQPSVQQVQEAIDQGNDPAELNRSAFDPLVYAILEKTSIDVIKLLLSQEGNEVNKLTHDGRTYIFWAAYKNNLELMKYLLSAGALTDIIDEHGYSLLNFSAVTGQKNLELYDFIIANGANPLTETNNDGANALLLLFPHLESTEMVDYFIGHGLTLDDRDDLENGAFYYAARGGNVAMLKWLIEQGIDYRFLNTENGSAFIAAAEGRRGHTNSLETFQYLTEIGLEASIITLSGQTPLIAYAARGEDPAVVEYLIDQGNLLDYADKDGNNALMRAAKYNKIEIVNALLSGSKMINSANNKGETALMMAVERNAPAVVDRLLQSSADPTLRDKAGNNLGFYLVKSFDPKNLSVFESKWSLLREYGFSLTLSQDNGNTLYHLSAIYGKKHLFRVASELGLDINAKNKEGMTALHIAAMKTASVTTLTDLIELGANTSLTTEFDEDVYLLASENELLTEQGADLNFLKSHHE